MIRASVFAAAAAMAMLLTGAAAHAAGNAENGEKVFKRSCTACHIATKDGAKRLGPPLFGIVGRKSGSVEGFRYTEANKSANVTWTPDVLNTYLTDPKKMIPGTTMAFVGIKNDAERADLIAYLETLK